LGLAGSLRDPRHELSGHSPLTGHVAQAQSLRHAELDEGPPGITAHAFERGEVIEGVLAVLGNPQPGERFGDGRALLDAAPKATEHGLRLAEGLAGRNRCLDHGVEGLQGRVLPRCHGADLHSVEDIGVNLGVDGLALYHDRLAVGCDTERTGSVGTRKSRPVPSSAFVLDPSVACGVTEVKRAESFLRREPRSDGRRASQEAVQFGASRRSAIVMIPDLAGQRDLRRSDDTGWLAPSRGQGSDHDCLPWATCPWM